jgi:hypothetical protein
MQKKSKINIVEKILMLMIVATAEVADFFATLGAPLPIIGPALPFASWFYGLAISGIILFWLIMKGVSIRWFLGGSGIELIPLINALPFKTAALIATFAEDALPEEGKAALGVATGKKTPSRRTQARRVPTQQSAAPTPVMAPAPGQEPINV